MSRLEEITKEVIRVLGKYQTSVVTITDIETFHNYVTSCIEAGIVAIDTETNNSLDPLTCKLMGLCLYAPGLQYAYVPINHLEILDTDTSDAESSPYLHQIF